MIQVERKNNLNILIAIITAFCILMPAVSPAKEIMFQASLDRNIIYLDQTAQLSLQFDGSSKLPAPDVPQISGLQSRYLGPSTRMSIVNGQMSSSVTHSYRIVPTKTGKFTIGPLTVEHKDNTYSSNKLTLEVLDSASRRHGRSNTQRQPAPNVSDRVFVEMHTAKDKLYVNEITPLTIKLFISSSRVRDIQYPSYNHDGFSVEEFNKPKQYKANIDGVIYDVVEFQTKIFATKAGQFALGPAKLKANIVTQKKSRRHSFGFDDFFGRDPFDGLFGNYESHPVELSSDELRLTILSLPNMGKPEDFKSAVGNFSMNLTVSPQQVRVGDPVTLKMTITGKGNFGTVQPPLLENDNLFKVYEPQIRQENNRKIFEQVLIPISENVSGLPDISFSYFDPNKEQYRSIIKKKIPLIVTMAERNEEITILDPAGRSEQPLKREIIGRDIIYIKESPGKLVTKDNYLYRNPFFLIMQIIPLICFAAFCMYRRKQERLNTDIGYARRLSAPKKAKKGIRESERYLQKNLAQEFYDTLFKTMRDYLGDRFHIPSGGITEASIDTILADKNLDVTIASKLKNIFRECDMVRYAPAEFNALRMNETLKDMKETIGYLEKQKN